MKDWTFTEANPHFEVGHSTINDGRQDYVLAIPCACGCQVAAWNPDYDGSSEGYRDCSTFDCPGCGADVDRDDVYYEASKEELIAAVAASIFGK